MSNIIPYEQIKSNNSIYINLYNRIVEHTGKWLYVSAALLNDIIHKTSENPVEKSWVIAYNQEDILKLSYPEKKYCKSFYGKVKNLYNFKLRICYLAIENFETYKILKNYYQEDVIRDIYNKFSDTSGISTSYYQNSNTENSLLIIINGNIFDIRNSQKIEELVDFYIKKYLINIEFMPFTVSENVSIDFIIEKFAVDRYFSWDKEYIEALIGSDIDYQEKIISICEFISTFWQKKWKEYTVYNFLNIIRQEFLDSAEFKTISNYGKHIIFYCYLIKKFDSKKWEKLGNDLLFQIKDQKMSKWNKFMLNI